jgi:REP element-mobilizing transposase RayT
LEKVLTETITGCLAWSLMPNHFHLLLRTGTVPIATVMRRLLTGYAQDYNRRHNRHGQLFQNRYKSILCQEEPYLMELVRYIHLNPLRARIVGDMTQLDTYAFSGHAALLGRIERVWQDVGFVLSHFGKRSSNARKQYRAFVEHGIHQGHRYDLIGGGLVRSAGGWKGVLEMRANGGRLKGDERILGDTEFVLRVMREAEETLERQMKLKHQGWDLERLAQRVKELTGINPLRERGRYRPVVQARRLFCTWAVHDLGMSGAALAKELGITPAAVSMAVRQGNWLIEERGWTLQENN